MAVEQVCNLATLKCSEGLAPGTLMVLPVNRVMTTSQPAATIMDNIPMMNIMPFGMCKSNSNPMVIAATSAAMGTPTPAPCIPMTTVGPWSPGATDVLINNIPALDKSSTLKCMWAGTIEVQDAGQTTHKIP